MATLASFADKFVDSVQRMPGEFLDVANNGPMSAFLMIFGVLFVGAAVAAMAYLTAGAVFSLFTIESPEQPPRAR